MINNKRLRFSNLVCRLSAVIALVLAAATHVARADDIDAYSNPAGAGGVPNVLIIIDNSSNWSGSLKGRATKAECEEAGLSKDEYETKMGAEKCALYKLFKLMNLEDLKDFNFAIMFFNESPDSSGYPRKAFVNISTEFARTDMLNLIKSFGRTKDNANNAATAESFYEAWQWFSGSNVWRGDKTLAKNDVNAFTDSSRKVYKSPGVGCAKNHIVYIANGKPQDNNVKVKELLQKINPAAQQFRIPISEGVSGPDEDNWADEFAAFFSNAGDLSTEFEGQQGIQVHTIAVTGAPSDGLFPNFFKWLTKQGGGEYREAKSPEDILEGLKSALNAIRASNSSFSSASLPASANTQGAFLNQVFIGMFRPDGNALQRWVGNLKQYQFKYDEKANTLELADSLGNPAVSTVTGFISNDAVSFWTQPSSYWINAEIKSSGKISASDSPDGPLVEKGGIGQSLRTAYPTQTDLQDTRTVYTCLGTGCGGGTSLKSAGSGYLFHTSNSTLTSALGSNLINWIRGEENVTAGNVSRLSVAVDQLTSPPSGVFARPAMHGDVLHSRPVALNYAKEKEAPNVVVYYGSNDGMLRAINGNQTGLGAGTELWAFVAPEHFATLNRLRENDPAVKYPNTPATATAEKRSYYFDGPIGAYQNLIDGKVMIFPTMRRGGRSVYAFDVSVPGSPKLAWRINESKSGYSAIGQTWSTPRVARVKGHPDPVLIMGGGYDNVAEEASKVGTTTIGRGVYVIDMINSGDLLGHLLTDDSVPSDVSFLDTDGDGYVDRAYLVDVRANVYRVDMEAADGTALTPSNWKITKLASFNDADISRRVFFAPDVVKTNSYIAVMLGTGDRENPLETVSNDRFYIMKDRKVSKGAPSSVTLLTDALTDRVVPMGDLAVKTDPDACYVQMASDGEKVINQPITFGGITYFSTSKPTTSAKSCSTILSKAYKVPLICRAPTSVELVGDGLPPSPVVGYVEIGGKTIPFVIGGPNSKKSAIEVERPNLSIPGNRKRSYWFMQNQDR